MLNKSYHELARHYGTTLVQARARKPKDKAADENIMGIILTKIMAASRKRQSFSPRETNRN
jgi:hypothetical protein